MLQDASDPVDRECVAAEQAQVGNEVVQILIMRFCSAEPSGQRSVSTSSAQRGLTSQMSCPAAFSASSRHQELLSLMLDLLGESCGPVA